ncbi:MAG: ATP-dependent Clp protease ATP-binding subunit [Candidatus Promineifilaceae bacterium]|nr:ATP-dependent Clp protease ATP-binding subunit [Candidatus Promineifilaceae bacterium]
MSSLNPNIPSPELSRLMSSAAAQMAEYKLSFLTPQLLLRLFLDERESAAYKILQQLHNQRGADLEDLVRRVEMMARSNKGRDAKFNFTDDFGHDIPLDEELLVVIDEGLTIAQAREEMKVGSGHALAAMAQPNVTTFGVLQRTGISSAAVVALLDEFESEGSIEIIRDFVQEAKEGEATAYYQRELLLVDLISILLLSKSRHVLLVGPEGAGRRTLAYSLAQLIAEGKGPAGLRSVVQINETALLENPLAAIRAALRRASGGILLVPDIRRFFADRLRAPFPQQINHEMQKAILNGEQVVIGTATVSDFDYLSQESIVRQNMQRLDVPAANRNEAVAMLTYHKTRLEQEYEVKVNRDALETAVTLADQYIKTIALPASAVQLADRSCALVRMVTQEHTNNLPEVAPDGVVDSEDIMVAASKITKIPISRLDEDEQGKYAAMAERLHERIIGQGDAVLAVSRAVKTARVGLRDPKKPIGSFLFLGPSGVGKTELAKALAEFMFGSEEAMLVLDMSEYQEEASVNRLIGAPPGYVGYEGGGQLTDFVRDKPYTVVLFDEIEKAHPRVLDVLLQVMDEGRMTDSQGRLTTFSETVVIMTSNLGAKDMLVPVIGERERDLVMGAVRRFFRPEFLNRLDEIILFHQLTPEQLAQILDLILKKELRLAARQGIDLSLSPAAKRWLLAQNDQPQFGARPLRRIISRHLREPLADYLLSQSARGEQTLIHVDANEDGLSFDIQE